MKGNVLSESLPCPSLLEGYWWRWKGQPAGQSQQVGRGAQPGAALCRWPLPFSGLCTASLSVFLGDGQPHPVPFDPGALWLCPLHASKTLTAQAVYSSSGTFQGVEALGPSYKGLGAQDVSPRNTTPQSPPAPDACRLHTSKDIKQPELSSSRCLQLHCLPSLGKELPIHFLAGTLDPPRSPLFGFRDGK